MRLNPDCVRAILLSIEDKSTFGESLLFPMQFTDGPLDAFSLDELRYHLDQCIRSGFVRAGDWFIDGTIEIHDLTPAGHEFAARVRADTTWAKVKSIVGKLGAGSLAALGDIVASVIGDIVGNGIGG